MIAARAVAVCALCAGLGSFAGLAAAESRPTPAPESAAPEPVLTHLTAQPILRRRVTAKPAELQAALREAFFALVGEAMKATLDLAGPPLARYQTRSTAADAAFTVDAALPLRAAPRQPVGPGFVVDQLPAGPAATFTHRGRLVDLPRSHAAVDAWLTAHRRRVAGPRWEIFVTNPVTTPDPNAQHVTLVVPLAP